MAIYTHFATHLAFPHSSSVFLSSYKLTVEELQAVIQYMTSRMPDIDYKLELESVEEHIHVTLESRNDADIFRREVAFSQGMEMGLIVSRLGELFGQHHRIKCLDISIGVSSLDFQYWCSGLEGMVRIEESRVGKSQDRLVLHELLRVLGLVEEAEDECFTRGVILPSLRTLHLTGLCPHEPLPPDAQSFLVLIESGQRMRATRGTGIKMLCALVGFRVSGMS